MKQAILDELNLVKRQGTDSLIEWLLSTDFFEAPASSKHHLCFQGGLAQHSWNVFVVFLEKNNNMNLGIDIDTIRLCGFLHDVCKCGLYLKQPDGTYIYDKIQIKQGHGRLSIERIEKFIQLTEEERAIIKFHSGTHGAFNHKGEEQGEYTPKELHDAIHKFPLVQVFASSDMEASLMEKAKEAHDGK